MRQAHWQFFKFLVVGGINTLFGYGVFALLIFLNVHYTVASFLATLLGVLFNFHTTGRLVFSNRDRTLIFKFLAVYGFTYLLNVAGLKVFSVFGLSYYTGGALLLLPMAAISFLLNKTFVFKKSVIPDL